MTNKTAIERDAADSFVRDAANHQMTVLHDDGLYRHLRFAAPDHGFSWFELITWPGALAIRGDHGGHTFARTDDMFTFFRRNGNTRGINPGYWAEKLPDGGRSVQVYSEDVLRAELDSHLAEYAEAYPRLKSDYATAKEAYDGLPRTEQWQKPEPVEPKSPAEIQETIADYDADGALSYESGAREMLAGLERAGVVSDTWEWDLSDWDYHYLWCCHAIVWGIAQYDAAKPVPTVQNGVQTVELAGVSR